MDCRYKLDYFSIAAQVRDARKQAGLTQAELAEKIDISTNAVAKLENNLMTVSLQTLVHIANTLHLDFNQLLSNAPSPGETSAQDRLLSGLLEELSPRDKDFLIHIIRGLILHNAQE